MKKLCVICGEEYTASPSDKRMTCAQPACVSARRRQTHQGRKVVWSQAARARASARGETPNLKLGTPAARKSPIAGPFETNQEAKLWWVRNLVTGDRYEVHNLCKFCRDHPELFAPDPWENAYAGLRQVQAWLVGKTPRQVSRWKTWTLEREAMYPHDE